MINGCVFQHNAIMNKLWILDFECMKLWVTSSTMQSMGSVKLLLISVKYIPPPPLHSPPPNIFQTVFEKYISWESGPSEKVMRGPKPSDFFVVQIIPYSSEYWQSSLYPACLNFSREHKKAQYWTHHTLVIPALALTKCEWGLGGHGTQYFSFLSGTKIFLNL